MKSLEEVLVELRTVERTEVSGLDRGGVGAAGTG